MLDQLGAQLVDLGHGQPSVVRDEQRLGRAQPLGQLGDDALLVLFLHLLTSSKTIRARTQTDSLKEAKTSSPIRLGWTSAAERCCLELVEPPGSPKPPPLLSSRGGGRLAPGRCTVLAEIVVNGNAMNAEIERMPVVISANP